MVPSADVNSPPSIEYSPPTILIATASSIPLIWIGADVNSVLMATSSISENAKASGVVSTVGVGVGSGVSASFSLPPPPPQAAIKETNRKYRRII